MFTIYKPRFYGALLFPYKQETIVTPYGYRFQLYELNVNIVLPGNDFVTLS